MKKRRWFLIAAGILVIAGVVFASRWWAPALFDFNKEHKEQLDTLSAEIAALTAIIAIAVAIIVPMWQASKEAQREAERKLEEGEKASQRSLGKLLETLAERYGVEGESLKLSVVITDLNGRADYTIEWRGLKVSPGSPMEFFEGQISVGETGQFEGPVKLKYYSISSNPSNKMVYLQKIDQTQQQTKYRVYVQGQLQSDDGQLDYAVQWSSTKAFLMSKQEAEQAYGKDAFPFEYVSHDLSYLAKKLELELTFPEEFHAQCHPMVFWGQTETTHNIELKRVKFQGGNGRALLTVENPLMGFSYLIYWEPPEGHRAVISQTAATEVTR